MLSVPPVNGRHSVCLFVCLFVGGCAGVRRPEGACVHVCESVLFLTRRVKKGSCVSECACVCVVYQLRH